MARTHLPRRALFQLAFTLLALQSSLAALTNLTIDDSDLSYFTWTQDTGSPQAKIPWAAVSPSTPCGYCSAQPQTTDISNQTWHDGGNNSAGSLTFQGSAVYIYGIDLDNPANISFELDGDTAPFHYYAGSEQFVFRSLFFMTANLAANLNHTVSWVLHATKTNGTTALFDYAVVSVGESSIAPSASASGSQSSSSASPSHKKSKAGPIAGGIVGGLALIAVVTLGLVFLSRRRNNRMVGTAVEEPRPFVEHASPVTDTAPGNSKTLDVAWNNPAPGSNDSNPTSTAPPTAAARSTTELSTIPVSSVGRATDATTSAPSSRERELEGRLAFLEAQVGQHLPPPYLAPPSE
ncbi:hypothetical protein C8R46DRAFT_1123721 [Mycena filopes]|nr:hypothetical protein C8R46DRAFT_1123721 [Mycena filopes]